MPSFSINVGAGSHCREHYHDAFFFQDSNTNNPLAHELTTGPEIIAAVVSTLSTPEHPSSNRVDAFIAGAGTGGTITGIARAIKKTHNKDAIVVAIDPVSIAFYNPV